MNKSTTKKSTNQDEKENMKAAYWKGKSHNAFVSCDNTNVFLLP